ncbi:MAG TPA: TlyA family rRNA (cytidine-2'-O)-methyltransferase [Clostridiales bacterium]|nr:TlyA family rRNA (cytidine-2'-O)-methyltransferase [Candidatus Apopatosoma intestinale]
MRADVFLFTHGFAESRSQAAVLIGNGVYISGKKIPKPSFIIPDDTPAHAVNIEKKLPFVSRGGLKLESALIAFHLEVAGFCVLDIGASTGGFTDCLLRYGADFVYALDVGHGQLAPSLDADPRVENIEGCNARYMAPSLFSRHIDMAVTDISFISQKLIYGAVRGLLDDGAPFVSLIKPQFEAGRENIGKGGIVKDPRVHERVIRDIRESALASGLAMRGICPSPIAGGDGNREYTALFIAGGEASISDGDIENTVKKAFAKQDKA